MTAILFVFALLVPSLLATESEKTATVVLTSSLKPSESLSYPHKYYSQEAQAAADKVLKQNYVVKEMYDYKEVLAKISDFIGKTVALLRAVDENRNCANGKISDGLNKIQEKIQAIMGKCASGYLKNESSKLDKVLTKMLDIDGQLQMNAAACTSLRVERPKGCDDKDKELKRKLNETVICYLSEYDKIRSKEEDIFWAEKYRLKNCFDNEIKECQERLMLLKKKFENNCKGTEHNLSSH